MDPHGKTLKEKLGLMTQLTSENFSSTHSQGSTGAQAAFQLDDDEARYLGSTLNCISKDVIDALNAERQAKDAQPLLFMLDMIHGFDLIMPIPLAQAASFDPALVRKASQLSATEASAAGVDVTFSPMCDLARDPRWGRVMEGYGEDVFLACSMIRAVVNGYHDGGLLSCIKHYISYSAPDGGREYNNAEISPATLYESYLPLYKAGIDAGADLVMCAFNSWNGIPLTCHKALLTDVLRGRLGFKGPVISDYAAVNELIAHGAAADTKEAAELALNAGVDIEMMSTCFLEHGGELVREGLVSEERIDEAASRVLSLWDHKPSPRPIDVDIKEVGIQLAAESAVLLKNGRSALPLSSTSVALTGNFASSRRVLGGWSLDKCEGLSLSEAFILDGITSLPVDDASTVIIASGEDQEGTGEGASRTSLRLPSADIEEARRLKTLGKTVILVVYAGRPLVLGDIEPYCDAILYAWFPGTYGNIAIKDLLLGKRLPQGKCPMSFPRNEGQIPINYDGFTTGRPWDGEDPSRYFSRYIDCPNSPLYPFGHGLTYGECSLDSARVEDGELAVTVTNRSAEDAFETLQVYVSKKIKGHSRRKMALRHFDKLACPGHSTTRTRIKLTKEMFMTDIGLEHCFVEGGFTLHIGFSSANTTQVSMTLTKEDFDELA